MAFPIEHFLIGAGQPCFVIAEAGVNHNGDVALAKELIRSAKQAGADCVKFQTFKAERVVTATAPKADYQLKTTNPKESQIEMLRKLELDANAYYDLVRLAQEEGIALMSTPYNEEDVDFLDELGVVAFKMASIHLFEPSFLRYTARKGKPLILSTGMATLADVDIAVRAIRETGNEQFVILQCTTNYPSRLEDANIRAMCTMRDALGALVGYSDHTQTHTACLTAVALGAVVIEKHFTLDKTMPGPDHSSSADPSEFSELVQLIREVERVLGSPIKAPTDLEKKNALGMRRSIVARRAIEQGEVITEAMLTFKRPASGLRPSLLNDIVGRKARRHIAEGALLSWDDITNE